MLSLYGSPVFTLVIGPSEDQLLVHQSVLARSPVLKSMCSEQFQEGQARVIKFPSENKRPFSCLISFLYSDDFIFNFSAESTDTEIQDLADVYVLADKYQVSGLKRRFIEHFLESRYPGSLLRTARIILDNVPDSDMAFRLFLEKRLQPMLISAAFIEISPFSSDDRGQEITLSSIVHQGGKIAGEIFGAQIAIYRHRTPGAKDSLPNALRRSGLTGWADLQREWEQAMLEEEIE